MCSIIIMHYLGSGADFIQTHIAHSAYTWKNEAPEQRKQFARMSTVCILIVLESRHSH